MTPVVGVLVDTDNRYWHRAHSVYSDRLCPAGETVAKIRPHLAELGITRVAQQTGLDRLNIPCYAAFRPNALSLSMNQGKGLTDDDAMASALMEALEFSIAENPPSPRRTASIRALNAAGIRFDLLRRLLPLRFEVPAEKPIDWLEAFHLFEGETVLVPLEAVSIDATRSTSIPYCRSTNGLASGNSQDEALFHALCELVERDAATLFVARGEAAQARSRVPIQTIGDSAVDHLVDCCRSADAEVSLFEMPTDLDVACFMALIRGGYPRDEAYFSVTAGYGCHPNAARAAIRAITEAAQGRITNIAGSRDDFDPSEYAAQLSPELAAFAELPVSTRLRSSGVGRLPLAALLDHLKSTLLERGIDDILVVPVGGEALDVSVVKVFAQQLEDRAPNSNWHPGARAVAAAMGAL